MATRQQIEEAERVRAALRRKCESSPQYQETGRPLYTPEVLAAGLVVHDALEPARKAINEEVLLQADRPAGAEVNRLQKQLVRLCEELAKFSCVEVGIPCPPHIQDGVGCTPCPYHMQDVEEWVEWSKQQVGLEPDRDRPAGAER